MTACHEAVLPALTVLHFLSLEQISRGFTGGSLVLARRLVAEVEQAGLVRRVRARMHEVDPLPELILQWAPGESRPDFGPLAYRLSKRWAGPRTAQTLVVATSRSAKLFGGHPGRIQVAALTHDLHMAEVYLHFRKVLPHRVVDWVSEATIAEKNDGRVLPDAAISDGNGGYSLFVEIAGHYNVERLNRFHAYCAAVNTPYELW